MIKRILGTAILVAFLQGCASYSPVVDTAGRSGTYNQDQAKEISNDLQHCRTLAKNNTTFIGNIVYWMGDPKAETEYEAIYKICMNNRGHSIIK